MELPEAKLAADQILNEECERPTIEYKDIAGDLVNRYKQMTPEQIADWEKITSVPRKNLPTQRKERPRPVIETPQIFEFSGTNFGLLMSVYGSVNEEDRPQMIEYIVHRVENGGTRIYGRPQNYFFPTLSGMVCELPLVAEFCIRTGNIGRFFVATAKPKWPTYQLAIMMMQLEEMIALNWDLFDKEQLGEIPGVVSPLARNR